MKTQQIFVSRNTSEKIFLFTQHCIVECCCSYLNNAASWVFHVNRIFFIFFFLSTSDKGQYITAVFCVFAANIIYCNHEDERL